MKHLLHLFDRCEPVGSRITCNPAPTDTDEDFLVLINKSKRVELFNALSLDGYELGGSIPFNEETMAAEDTFSSFTKGHINIIATVDPVFFEKFMIATAEAKRLNLLVKSDRIALFQKILYGNIVQPTTRLADLDDLEIEKMFGDQA